MMKKINISFLGLKKPIERLIELEEKRNGIGSSYVSLDITWSGRTVKMSVYTPDNSHSYFESKKDLIRVLIIVALFVLASSADAILTSWGW